MVVKTSVGAAVSRAFGSNSEREAKGMRGWCAELNLYTPGVVAKAAKTDCYSQGQGGCAEPMER
jgi:hypothetical protein